MTLRSGPQELLKWAALLLMAVDHVGALLVGGEASMPLRLVGRLAMPLFGALLAYNLVKREVPARRYLAPLAALAAISQLPFAAAFGSRGNVFFTLLLGVLLVAGAQLLHRRGADWRSLAALLLIGLVTGFSAPHVDYGFAGVLLVPAWALWWAVPRLPVAAMLVVDLLALNWGTIGAVVPLLVPGLLAWAAGWDFTLRRLPRWVAYAFYPVHLVGILFLSTLL